MRHIPNRRLVLKKIPLPDSRWEVIEKFALTFDGYGQWPEGVGQQIGSERRQGTLSELRTCLFFEQRSATHNGVPPDAEALRYIRGLLEQIRYRVGLADELLK